MSFPFFVGFESLFTSLVSSDVALCVALVICFLLFFLTAFFAFFLLFLVGFLTSEVSCSLSALFPSFTGSSISVESMSLPLGWVGVSDFESGGSSGLTGCVGTIPFGSIGMSGGLSTGINSAFSLRSGSSCSNESPIFSNVSMAIFSGVVFPFNASMSAFTVGVSGSVMFVGCWFMPLSCELVDSVFPVGCCGCGSTVIVVGCISVFPFSVGVS